MPGSRPLLHGKICPQILVCLALLLAVMACGPSAPSGAGQRVLLVSIDGLLPAYYLRADELGLQIPHLRRLVREGTAAEGAQSVAPAVTYPAHTTIITGMSPARHGIEYNSLFDPEGRGLGWYLFQHEIRTPTLFDAVRAAGRTSAAVWWPVTIGAPIEWNLPGFVPQATGRDARILYALASPLVREMVDEPQALRPMTDSLRTAVALRFLAERPDFAAVHLTALDAAQHDHGPFTPEAYAALEESDRFLGEMLETLDRTGMAGSTTIFLVSDHGFRPAHTVIRPGALLAQGGLIRFDSAGTVREWDAYTWGGGGSVGIFLRDSQDIGIRTRVDVLVEELEAQARSAIRAVVRGVDVAALGGYAGAHVVFDAGEGFTFSSRPGGPVLERLPRTVGEHGHLPVDPALDAALIISGPGIRRGGRLPRVRLEDVAPTIAAVLGVSLEHVEGRVLTDAFEGPTLTP